ncbi:MAG: tRNA lysidine(34) synthetase TilS [Agarilytica sp.]
MLNQDRILQEIRLRMSEASCLWLGFSGGLDSTVLAQLLAPLKKEMTIRLVHINHQLSPDANQWQAHCELQAERLGLGIVSRVVSVESAGRGVEQSARQARYRVFRSLLQGNDLLLLAHHADDVAETFFFRLMRGAGLTGLSAMQETRSLGLGQVYRPLLDCSKKSLEDYAAAKQLSWVEDGSNSDTQFDRNYLRASLMPVLKQRWPDALEKIAHSVRWLTESNDLFTEYGLEDLEACERAYARFGERINIEKFGCYGADRQKHMIRCWAQSLGFTAPDAGHMARLRDVIEAKEDAKPCLRWGRCELRRYQTWLYLVAVQNREEPAGLQNIPIDPGQCLTLPDGSELSCHCASSTSEVMEVRFRESGVGGEAGGQPRCKPRDRAHSQSLKKLLHEYHVEPWLRDRIPFIYCGGELVAVGDAFSCDHRQNLPEDLRFEWRCKANLPDEFD